MFYDIIIIGGGAAGLMAAYGAASSEPGPAVLVLEKMPRPGRKIMITGKGRCNFTNVKDWQDFSAHIRSRQNFLRPAFYNLTPEKLIGMLERFGMESVVERGDRAFPASHHASDVVDTLLKAATGAGAVIRTDSAVSTVRKSLEGFELTTRDGRRYSCRHLVMATGGLSYPSTGSTGDGYAWAKELGHSIRDCFPSLTAMVPKAYKLEELKEPVGTAAARVLSGGPVKSPYSKPVPQMKGHISRDCALSELGKSLCGIQLKNVGLGLWANGSLVRSETGDMDFTDGGIEGPIGFALSRSCVKAIINGSKVKLVLDLKPGVAEDELRARVKGLWNEIQKDPRSRKMSIKEMSKVLMGKLMPWELTSAFVKCNEGIFNGRKGNEHIDMEALARSLKAWTFEIDGFVGYERCVVTAGGVATEEVLPKTMESRLCPGLYLCGEMLDIDSDTGGYNLHTAFATGFLAGRSAATALGLDSEDA